MSLTPRAPHRPLLWPDQVLDIQNFLLSQAGSVFIVGGAVRDALMHRPVNDLDLAVDGSGIQVARKLANQFQGDFFVLDGDRDVGRALLPNGEGTLMVDVARLRGESLAEDLLDRDFTLNALAVDFRSDLNSLIDPLNGEGDIQQKLLRQCSSQSFQTDPVRVLRAVRLCVQLGFRLEPATLQSLRAVVPHLEQVSAERVRDELFKMLALSKPATAVRIAESVGIWRTIIPALDTSAAERATPDDPSGWKSVFSIIDYLSQILTTISYTRTDNTAASFGLGMLAIQLDRYRQRIIQHLLIKWPNGREHRALLVLAAMLQSAMNGKQAVQVGADLRLSVDEQECLKRLCDRLPGFWSVEVHSKLDMHYYWRQLGATGIDLCLLALAQQLQTYDSVIHQEDWLRRVEHVRLLLDAYFEHFTEVVEPPQLVDGNELMELLSLKPGPIIGRLLDRLREAQVTGEVTTRTQAVAALQRWSERIP
jgi:tRNA nucleotidyltransferase/poly(A) polymerase